MKGQEIHSIFLTLSRNKKMSDHHRVQKGQTIFGNEPFTEKWWLLETHFTKKLGRFASVAKKYCIYLILNEENNFI